MIQVQTYLNIADNTGVKSLMCLRILGNNKKLACVGDIIIGVAKKVLPRMTIKRSNIVRAIIVRTKKTINRNDGRSIRFEENAVIIIHTDKNPKGTRVFGPIAREIRDKKFMKIVSLADEVI